MISKKCFKCGEEKPLSEYYRHKKMADGRLGKCIVCAKEDTRSSIERNKANPIWVEKERDRCREKSRRLKRCINPEMKSLYNKRHRNKYPEKKRIRRLSGGNGFHHHHWSYNPEHIKDTILLRVRDHAIAHRFIKYDAKSFMYFDVDGNLLDTKDKHLEYIVNVIQSNDF